jgi:hypothetical protein
VAEAEVLAGAASLDGLRAGRPVLYMDQNKWSLLSKWEHGTAHLSEDEDEAAKTLVEFAADRKILIPVSAGHFAETGPLYGQKRIDLASTILTHSRGWQVRNPIHVRADELRLALTGKNPVASKMFSPAADELFSQPRRRSVIGAPDQAMEQLLSEMTGLSAVYDTIADAQQIPDEGGNAAAENWAQKWVHLSDKLHADGASKEKAWKIVEEHLVADLGVELRMVEDELGLEHEEAVRLLLASETDVIGQMPCIARIRSVLFDRVRNNSQTWTGNDLMDIVFLSSAAGYADVVIGERNAISYLRQVRQVPPGAKLGTSFRDALDLLGV